MRSYVPALLKIIVFVVVTVLLTAVLAMTVANANFGPTSGYLARFGNASGLQEGDDVRISGVKVGQIEGIAVGDDNAAEVRFNVNGNRDLPALVTATVKYRNLIGQRYLSLGTDVAGEGTLDPGEVIPADRTEPALNLTVLFNGFQPLFRALEPKQINQLSHEIIQVFQGEGGTVRSLLSHTASVTSTLAQKDQLIGDVIDNLNHVLNTVNSRTPQVKNLLDTTQQLVTGLAEQRGPIGEAVSGMAELTDVTAGLLEEARPPLKQNVAELGGLAGNLADSEQLIDDIAGMLPGHLKKFTRVVSYGSWFNYFLCDISGTLGIEALNVELPILPLPATEQPERCQV